MVEKKSALDFITLRKKAEKAVEDMPDGPLKEKAFEVIFKHLLEDESSIEVKHPAVSKEEVDISVKQITDEGIKKLAKQAKISVTRLRDVLDIGTSDFNITADVPGDDEHKRQLNATLVLLTAQAFLLKQRRIESAVLRKKLENLGIAGLVNLSTNLRRYRKFIAHLKGKRGSRKTFYGIKTAGLKQGCILIKQMSKG